MPAPGRTALVTGANRGIGLEICRQLAAAGVDVVLTARDVGLGTAAAERLQGLGGSVRVEQLDVTDAGSVGRCAARLAEAGTAPDILVNNAGVYPTASFFRVEEDVMLEALDVNLLGAFRTCRAFVPGMVRRGFGRVVNISSAAGAMTGSTPGPAAYGISKAALNALTLVVAGAVSGDVRVNAVCPGWVRTRMGGGAAPLDVSAGADTAVWLATAGDDCPHGGFFQGRRRISW